MEVPPPQPLQLSPKGMAWLAAAILLFFAIAEAPFLYNFARARVFLYRAQHAPSNTLAMFFAREAYLSDPSLFPAVQLLGDLNEAAGNPQSLAWRVRASQLRPEDKTVLLQWARTALVSGNTRMAFYALAKVPEKERKDAAFHSLMAGAAVQSGNRKEAEEHFAEAVRLDPQNVLYAVNYSVFGLASPDQKTSAAARNRLQEWEKTTAWGNNARRALIDDDTRRGDWESAWKRSLEMTKSPEATIGDWLSYLATARRAQPLSFDESLARIKEWLLSHPRGIYDWLNWMRRNGFGRQAIEWVQNQNETVKTALPVRVAIADIRVEGKDWELLTKELTGVNWGDFDFSRELLLIRSMRERGEPGAAAAWDEAWLKLKNNPANMLLASQILQSWKWEEETETIWWRLGQTSPQYREMAWDLLMNKFRSRGNTPGLLLVALRELEAKPENPVAQNNYAFLALLTNKDLKRANDLAERVYQRYPLHPTSVSTYALSLYRQGRSKEGLLAMEKLTAEQRNDPSIALYEGILWKAEGRPDKAMECFVKATPGNFLPEEKKLADGSVP